MRTLRLKFASNVNCAIDLRATREDLKSSFSGHCITMGHANPYMPTTNYVAILSTVGDGLQPTQT